MALCYRLDGSPCEIDELDYANPNRIIARTYLNNGDLVSTVFLGINLNWDPDGPPLIFETMVFPHDEWLEKDCQRYSTWEEAVAGHADMVAKWQTSRWDGILDE